MARNIVKLAQDVPQSYVDATDRRRANKILAMPEVLAVHLLPQIFDPRYVLTDQEL